MTARTAFALSAALAVLASASPSPAYEPGDVKHPGTVSGAVRFRGAPPRLAAVPVSKHRELCGDDVPAEALVVGPDRGVKGAVILIDGIARGKASTADVVIETQRCRFVSHVTAAGPGDRVRVKNADAVLHSARGLVAGVTVFNVALPGKDQVIDITRHLRAPAVVRVRCDVQPHMAAWLVVHDSPYVAVTDERGAYRITGVPPGTYTVRLWHEGFRARRRGSDGRPVYAEPRTITRTLTVAPDGAATLDFDVQ